MRLSVVLPAKNEEIGLATVLPELVRLYPNAEIIVADDGSSDDTASVAIANRAKVISAPYSMGNGAAIKRGASEASGDVLVFMDADGQHDPNLIGHLLEKINNGYDMAVGARDATGQASFGRGLANRIYNRVASWMTGHQVLDLTSGFRAVRAEKFKEFIHLLPNGFSYPTTITMAFFRSAYSVAYVALKVRQRSGAGSHIRPLRDGVRFLLIIFKVATLYSPLRIFVPVAALFFLGGVSYYAYTFVEMHRFTNMSMLMFASAVIIFLIGLISEQITVLTFSRPADKPRVAEQ